MRSTYLGLMLLAAALTTGGCAILNAEPSNDSDNSGQPPVNPIEIRAIAPPLTQPASPEETARPSDQVTITRYKIDAQCEKLLPTDLNVPTATSLDSTIKTIVGDRSNGDFRIADYRIKQDTATNTVTIDLHLPPDAARSIYSLSHCEQFALLGELRQTLVANSTWKIDSVNFQVQGKMFEY